MKLQGSLPCSQKLATSPYKKLEKSSPVPPTLFLQIHFNINTSIYIQVFQLVQFHRVSHQNIACVSFPPSYVPHTSSIFLFLYLIAQIISGELYNPTIQFVQPNYTICTTQLYNLYNTTIQFVQHNYTICTTQLYNLYNTTIQFVQHNYTICTTQLYNFLQSKKIITFTLYCCNSLLFLVKCGSRRR